MTGAGTEDKWETNEGPGRHLNATGVLTDGRRGGDTGRGGGGCISEVPEGTPDRGGTVTGDGCPGVRLRTEFGLVTQRRVLGPEPLSLSDFSQSNDTTFNESWSVVGVVDGTRDNRDLGTSGRKSVGTRTEGVSTKVLKQRVRMEPKRRGSGRDNRTSTQRQ